MSYLHVPPYMADLKEWVRKIALRTNDITEGKTNNTGSFTLTASSATTTVTLASGRIGENTVIHWTPKTANAAAETLYESSRDVINATFTLTHTNNTQTDRTFDFTLIG